MTGRTSHPHPRPAQVLVLVALATTLVGARAPAPERPVIDTPADGAVFLVGENVAFHAVYSAADNLVWTSSQDGTLARGAQGVAVLTAGRHTLTAADGSRSHAVKVRVVRFCDHPATDCSSLNSECAKGTCDAALDRCVAVARNEHKSCDDGDAATGDDTCRAGVCAGTPCTCSGRDRCCDGCFARAEGRECDDGDARTGNDTCTAGVCAGTPCTCDTRTTCCDGCFPEHEGRRCNDHDASTGRDVCRGGACVGTACTCDTRDRCCNGCLPRREGKRCGKNRHDDRSTEVCHAGVCGDPAGPIDPTPPPPLCMCVTVDACCDGCRPVNAGGACDDGLACTKADACNANGVCVGGGPTDCSSLDGACATGVCDEAAGGCTTDFAPHLGAPCDDADACTLASTCGADGTCGGGLAVDCSGLLTTPACEAASCDAAAGCRVDPANEGGTCDDGNARTTADRCESGVCRGIACTCATESACCDGCMPRNLGGACSDGLACTTRDTCGATGVCVGGPAPDCSALDGACATGVCREDAGGCTADPSAHAGKACDDANACTMAEVCAGDGTCGGGVPVTCAGLLTTPACQTASCDPAAGCRVESANEGGACDDGQELTIDDHCEAGSCTGTVCECVSGPCCDGCRFLPADLLCDAHVASRTRCAGGGCGADVVREWSNVYCSGTSGSCNGAAVWENLEIVTECDAVSLCQGGSAPRCVVDRPTCDTTFCNEPGPCCDEIAHTFRGNETVCDPGADAEFGCPTGAGCGATVGSRARDRLCSGHSVACDGPFGAWTSWDVLDVCAPYQACTAGSNVCVEDPECLALPDTGQDACYARDGGDPTPPVQACRGSAGSDACSVTSGCGQDAQYASSPPNYTVLAGAQEVVVDNLTGLQWQRATTTTSYSQPNAVNYCNGLVYGGHDDWRLPNALELVMIVNYQDFGDTAPRIDAFAFPNTPRAAHWTATRVTPTGVCSAYTQHAWTVNFDTARLERVIMGQIARVRCVRGHFAPLFARDASGPEPVVRDAATGLEWASAQAPTGSTWSAALAWCEGLTWAGAHDWRVPNVRELATMLYHGRCDPAVDAALFPEATAEPLWTSTSYIEPNGSLQAWLVDFQTGEMRGGAKGGTRRVRCVRGGR